MEIPAILDLLLTAYCEGYADALGGESDEDVDLFLKVFNKSKTFAIMESLVIPKEARN